MMNKVELHINGLKVEHFESYRIEADLFTAADAFSLTLINPEVPLKAGQKIELWINGVKELVGISDRVVKSHDKSGTKLTVEGRDLMGILVDAYCETFTTYENIALQTLTEKLIKKVPHIQRNNIVYPDAKTFGLAQIEPGATVFEVLKDYASARGLLFYAMPDGKFHFDRPLLAGDSFFSLVCKRDGKGNNVLSGELVEDVSKRYSKVVVFGQKQDTGGETADFNIMASVPDEEFENKVFYKPFYHSLNQDEKAPELKARLMLEKMRQEGFQLNYRVAGHGQNGKNWAINQMVFVDDETLELRGYYLLYGRTFEMSKQGGTTTSLRLGLPGMMG